MFFVLFCFLLYEGLNYIVAGLPIGTILDSVGCFRFLHLTVFSFYGSIEKADYHHSGIYTCVFLTEPQANATIEVKGKSV